MSYLAFCMLQLHLTFGAICCSKLLFISMPASCVMICSSYCNCVSLSVCGTICSSMLDLSSNPPGVGGMPPLLREIEPIFRGTSTIIEDDTDAHHWREAVAVMVLLTEVVCNNGGFRSG